MKRLLVPALILILTCNLFADETAEKSIEEQVDAVFADWNSLETPGASLAVLRDGIVIYRKGYGSAQLEYGVPITPSTIFHVASVSKQFTAMAATMLADQGKLSLDDDIRTHLPYVPDFGVKITVRQLIHHISGLRDQWELLAMAGWRLDDVITLEHILKLVRHQKELNFEPGAEYLYCNTGYTLLAEIVTKVSGTPFPEWCDQNIFKPLGMTSTHFHDDHQMIVKNRSYSYSGSAENGFRKSVLSYANVGATSLFTTVEDLTNWMRNFEEKKVGGETVIAQMQNQGILNSGDDISYAHGLLVSTYRGLKTVGHGGADAGFRSSFMYFPDQRFGVVVLSNFAAFNPADKARKVADVYLKEVLEAKAEQEERPERTAVEIDPEVLNRYVGRFDFEDWIVATFTREEDKFFVNAAGMSKAELFPMSETEFFMKIADVLITFEKGEGEKSTKLTLLQEGTKRVATRLPDLDVTPDLLEQYTGEYYSDELGTTYTLAVKDDALVATHRRHNDIPLEFNKVDNFLGNHWFFRKLNFIRDADKRIDGFLLTGGRVRNLRFDKVN